MAIIKKSSSDSVRENKRKKRPGIHSKCKSSKIKTSKHYLKRYRGQGR